MATSDALNIARASAPSSVVIIECIEIRHDSFPAPIRLTNQRADVVATLEATAPEDASTAVTFTAAYFDLTLPRQGAQGTQSLNLVLGNVDKAVRQHLDIAVANPTPITVIYRHYLSTDTSAPAVDPPPRLTFRGATADVFTVNAEAATVDWINGKLHSRKYTLLDFPGLRTA